MALPPKKPRMIRVEDDLWQAAQAKAEATNTGIPHEIREFLKRWVAEEEPAK